MCLFLETLMSFIRTGEPILVKLIDLVNSGIIFLSQMILLRLPYLDPWLTLIVLLFRIYFFLLTLVFVLQWLSLHWEILIMWLSPCYFHWLSIRCPVSLLSLWLFLCWLGWYLWSFERCSMGNIYKLSVTAAANEFCEWVQVGIDVYIPYWKCQLNPQSSS